MKTFNNLAVSLGLLFSFVIFASGQDFNFGYFYSFEPAFITQGPKIGEIDIKYPDEARKNGVDGKAKVKFTLGEDGKVRNIVIVEDLPFGIGAAAVAALEKLKFTPATNQGRPTAIDGT